MNILDTVLFAAGLLAVQVVLAAILIAVFMRLRIVERDERLPDEYGKTPFLEVTGAGQIGDTGWSMRPMCRISLYDDFLVVAVRARRSCLPYDRIACVEDHPKRTDAILMRATARGEDSETEIGFRCKKMDAIIARIKEKLPQEREQ